MSPIRLLIFDILFPDIHGRWREVEINWFLTHPAFETDVLIYPHATSWIPNQDIVQSFKTYYDAYPHLNNYHILIFNPKFNCLNQFNRTIDGTKYNGCQFGDYLLTRRPILNLSQYDIGYAIFLHTWLQNYQLINRRLWPMITKIYPGGGIYHHNQQQIKTYLTVMNKNNEAIIVTQPLLFELTMRQIAKVHKIYGLPLLDAGTQIRRKTMTQVQSLDICFYAIGAHPKKGFHNYVKLINHLGQNYPDAQIRFHIVGYTLPADFKLPSNAIYHKVMAPRQLDNFLYEVIDIVVTPVIKFNDPDGFPLNAEAMLQGCIPIQTDPYQSNSHYQFSDLEGLFLNEFNLDTMTAFILRLYHNRSLRQAMSHRIIDKVVSLFSPSAQLEPIVRIMQHEIFEYQLPRLLRSIPTDEIGGCLLTDALQFGHLILNHKLKSLAEIGVWRGRSLAALTLASRLNDGQVYAIDPYTADNLRQFDSTDRVKSIIESSLAKMNLDQVYQETQSLFSKSEHVHVLRLTSSQALHQMPVLDLLHIDGNHDTDCVEADMQNYLPKVRAAGFIILNASDWPSVRLAISHLMKSAKLVEDHARWQLWQKNLL